MRSINAGILLRNRRVISRLRDGAFAEAAEIVDEILAGVAKENPPLAPEQLKHLMDRLVDRLFAARYYARLSVGGSNVETPAEIGNDERAFTDHVETMYSYSRSINRFLKHELLMASFVRDHPDVSADLRAYVENLRRSDVSLVFANLRSMRTRLKLYERYMTRRERTPAVPTPAAAKGA